MSGILAIFHRDRSPIDQELLGAMTAYLSFRGPDARHVWLEGDAGLGHTLLQTTPESTREQQPASLDSQVWITADARIDGRAELMARLEAAGRRGVREATDPELILHAYHVWGEECLEHLLGDFAFAIWDGRRRVLFCARDHFGVKPFYYAEAGAAVLCSNTLNCLRLHPGISDALHDTAIADFLLFDRNEDPATTCFSAIRRLPAAHCLVATERGVQIHRYWTLAYRELRLKRTWDYVEGFSERFREASRDRLRTEKATVLMSGGADSTLVAAVAHQVLGKASDRSGIRAHTFVFDRLIPDEERKYAQLAADFIPIPIEHMPLDEYRPFERHLEWQFAKPQPDNFPLSAIFHDRYRHVARYSPVVLTGFGGDPALHTDEGYIARYFKPGAWAELLFGIGWCIRVSGRIPRLGIRTMLKGSVRNPAPPFLYPSWLSPELEKRLDLNGRWERISPRLSPFRHARSIAHAALLDPVWEDIFETLDAGMTRFPVELRHPFFDRRVVTFLLGMPSLPWCQEKNIIKAAGIGLLPDPVRTRPKAPLGGNPLCAHLHDAGPEWWARHFQPVPELAAYVEWQRIPMLNAADPQGLWTSLRPVSLNYWLQLGRKVSKLKENKRFTLS